MSSSADRERLRRLAAECSENVNSDAMDARRERWRLSNRLEARTVPLCGAMKERVAEACEILHRVTGH